MFWKQINRGCTVIFGVEILCKHDFHPIWDMILSTPFMEGLNLWFRHQIFSKLEESLTCSPKQEDNPKKYAANPYPRHQFFVPIEARSDVNRFWRQ